MACVTLVVRKNAADCAVVRVAGSTPRSAFRLPGCGKLVDVSQFESGYGFGGIIFALHDALGLIFSVPRVFGEDHGFECYFYGV